MALKIPIQQQERCQKSYTSTHYDVDDDCHDVHSLKSKAFVDPIQHHSGDESDHSQTKDHRHNVFHRSEVHTKPPVTKVTGFLD